MIMKFSLQFGLFGISIVFSASGDRVCPRERWQGGGRPCIVVYFASELKNRMLIIGYVQQHLYPAEGESDQAFMLRLLEKASGAEEACKMRSLLPTYRDTGRPSPHLFGCCRLRSHRER